ncbi:MAG: hypothetical protein ABGY15_09140 [bacterium]
MASTDSHSQIDPATPPPQRFPPTPPDSPLSGSTHPSGFARMPRRVSTDHPEKITLKVQGNASKFVGAVAGQSSFVFWKTDRLDAAGSGSKNYWDDAKNDNFGWENRWKT